MARSAGTHAGSGARRPCRLLVYAFLYLPILVLVALSFNETGRPVALGRLLDRSGTASCCGARS